MKNKICSSALLGLFAAASGYAATQVPSNIYLHSPLKSVIPLRDFGDHSEWYYTKDNGTTQVFRLGKNETGYEGDAANPGRIRVETFMKDEKSANSSDWRYFQCTYRMDKHGGPADSTHAILQMKEPPPNLDVQWEVQINYDGDNSVRLNHRRLPDQILGRNMLGKEFTIRVASNGRRYKVWYNGTLVSNVEHQMSSNGSRGYSWRWGMYTQRQYEASTLVVKNISTGHTTSAGAWGYTKVANENQTVKFFGKVNVAYGANGKYAYRYDRKGDIKFYNRGFGDPIPGVAKKGYYQNAGFIGPSDYIYCAQENETVNFGSKSVDVAYGINGSYKYRSNKSGNVKFYNTGFGGDPAPGVKKAGFYKY